MNAAFVLFRALEQVSRVMDLTGMSVALSQEMAILAPISPTAKHQGKGKVAGYGQLCF